nr:hypothetical protein [Alphaproteobacteria bacterium]
MSYSIIIAFVMSIAYSIKSLLHLIILIFVAFKNKKEQKFTQSLVKLFSSSNNLRLVFAILRSF